MTAANSGASLWGSGELTYDAMGNLKSASLGPRVQLFQYQAGTPKLASVSENGASRLVTYDAAGNEISAGTWISSYSPRNYLQEARTATFAYDGRGVRTRAVVPEWPALHELEVSDRVGGGRTIQAGILVNGPAPAAGIVVALQSSAAAVAVPPAVTIPGGATEVSFEIVASAVAQPVDVVISAQYGSTTLTRTVTVVPPALEALTFSGTTVPGGQSITGVVTMTALAAEGGVVLQAESSHPSVLSVPATIAVSEGADEASIAATSSGPVPAALPVTIAVRYAGASRSFVVTVLPPPVTSLTVTPSTVEGGAATSARVTLQSAAAAGTQVTFESSNAAVQAPAPVTMNAGSQTAEVSVATAAVTAAQSAVLTATLAPTSATAAVVVQPPAVTLQSFTVSEGSLVGSNMATGTVALTAPAPAGGLDVELSPYETGLVPPYVTVAAGATSATFEIATAVVAATEQKQLTARHGATTLTCALEILPAAAHEDVALYEPGIVPVSEDERRVGGSSFEFYATTDLVAMEEQGGRVTGRIPWDPGEPSGYSLFGAETHVVTQPTDAAIFITKPGMKDRERVVIVPAIDTVILRAVTIESSVIGGMNATGTVVLSDPALAGGMTVALSGSRAGLAAIPASVTVPAGEMMATFTVPTQQTATSRGVLVRATYGAQLRTAVLSVDAALPLRAPARESETDARPTREDDHPPASRTGSLQPLADSNVPEQHFLYTPELNLMAEAAGTNGAATMEYEYLWFSGQPVAQIESRTGAVHYYFNDHLGTPILTTDAAGTVDWRVERTPYGETHALRTGATRHQPLSFPGQESSDLEITYNIFRWYRAGWGRYTQADPIGLRGGPNLFAYAEGDPVGLADPLGLYVQLLCRQVSAVGEKTFAKKILNWYKPLHCRLRVKCPCDVEKASGYDVTLGRENVNPKGSPGIYDTTKDDYSTSAYPPSAWATTSVSGPAQNCQFERCLLKAFNALDNNPGLVPKYNAYPGPNSNTFVASLINQCGGSAQFPEKAAGYDYND